MADACTHWRIQLPVLLQPHVVLRVRHFQAICIFLRPTMGVKKLTCESRVVKNGKRIRVVEATIYGDNGQEISRGLLEYMDMQRKMVVK